METVVTQVISWLEEAGRQIKDSLQKNIEVDHKTSRNDLVTNIDKETQRFLIDKIKAFDPEAKILAEEDGYTKADISTGRVYVIDPIDGTLNFVFEKENFCVMLAIFEHGVGRYGFIYDVMKHELYWGNQEVGVFCNEHKLPKPQNVPLADGLIGMNAHMFANDPNGVYEIGDQSMGVRCTGCAGLEMINMITGRHNGYVSKLSPWDYAAGIILLDAFDFRYSNEMGRSLNFTDREYFFGGTEKTYTQMMKIMGNKGN